MLVPCNSIVKKIQQVEIVFQPLGFSATGSLLSDAFCALDEKGESAENELANCFLASFNHYHLLRCGTLDTESKAKGLLSIVSALDVHRLCSIQLNSPENEWDSIVAQHYWLAFLKEQQVDVAHVNLPSDYFFMAPLDPRRVTTAKQTLETLSNLMNGEGWALYGDWLSLHIKKVLENFKPEAVDEYQLEAVLIDFLHEVQSHFYQDLRKQTDNLTLEWGKESQVEKKIEIEQKLIRLRLEMQKSLSTHSQVLASILAAIERIEENHPELATLKQEVILLHELLKDYLQETKLSWGQQVMLQQLLSDRLEVLTVSNCQTGLERTSFAFSIQLALQLMQRDVPLAELLHLALHWDQIVKAINLFQARKGLKNFHKWLSSPSPRKEEEDLRKEAILANRLREGVLMGLRRFSLPMTALSHHARVPLITDDQTLNGEFLNFLPLEGVVKNPEGERETALLLEIDRASGSPINLTAPGSNLLKRLADA